MRGKRDRSQVTGFVARLEENLDRMGQEIRDGTIEVGRYDSFVIHDPKQRRISAPCFCERVLHHAILNVCEPALEAFAISDSYSCRIGKGQFAALERAQRFAAQHAWFLKLDVRKYFESIPKTLLLDKLGRRFREEHLLDLLHRIVWSFEPNLNRGVPIGALTSQHFANFYLGYLDHFVKENLRFRGYVRYMDDFVLWHDDRMWLAESRRKIEAFLEQLLDLELNPANLNRTERGMDFLGYRVYPDGRRLNRRSRRRFRKRFRGLEQALEMGAITEEEAQARGECLVAFTKHGACRRYRRRVIFGSGARPDMAPTA